jgi:hypothetical protein
LEAYSKAGLSWIRSPFLNHMMEPDPDAAIRGFFKCWAGLDKQSDNCIALHREKVRGGALN